MQPQARILVVDDEAPLLSLIEKYLRRLGFEVETQADPAEALRRFEAAGGRFDVVMVDLELPGMSGIALIHKFLNTNPGLRALVCSGHPPQTASFASGREARIGFLQKPFLPKMLASALDTLLAENGATAAG